MAHQPQTFISLFRQQARVFVTGNFLQQTFTNKQTNMLAYFCTSAPNIHILVLTISWSVCNWKYINLLLHLIFFTNKQTNMTAYFGTSASNIHILVLTISQSVCHWKSINLLLQLKFFNHKQTNMLAYFITSAAWTQKKFLATTEKVFFNTFCSCLSSLTETFVFFFYLFLFLFFFFCRFFSKSAISSLCSSFMLKHKRQLIDQIPMGFSARQLLSSMLKNVLPQ